MPLRDLLINFVAVRAESANVSFLESVPFDLCVNIACALADPAPRSDNVRAHRAKFVVLNVFTCGRWRGRWLFVVVVVRQ